MHTSLDLLVVAEMQCGVCGQGVSQHTAQGTGGATQG